MEYKRIYLVLFVIFLISIFSGVTFSFWQWKSAENTEVVFDIESGASCATVNGGGNITSSEITLAPASCTNSKFAIKREIKITPVITEGNLTVMDLSLTVNALASGLSNSQNFKYVLTTSDSSCTDGVLASGNFYGKSVGDTVSLFSGKTYKFDTVDTYYLYVWLDKTETSTSTMHQSFDLSLGGTCSYNEILDFNVTLNANGGAISSVSYTTAGEHTYAIPYDANYHLEVWGASGAGGVNNYTPGYGGYSVGDISLTEGTNLFINVGGTGSNASNNNTLTGGGHNGGGNVRYRAGGGGGATHIALVSGALSSLSVTNNINDILIVAGGGGGAGYYNTNLKGGSGGGITGVDGGDYNTSNQAGGHGGTQSAGGALGSSTSTAGKIGLFGSGGQGGYNNSNGSGGGGGGFYGGAGGSSRYGGGGGGSGYIGNSLLTNKAMYCYNCTADSNVNTLTYSVGQFYDTATSNYPKKGDGTARISLLSSTKAVTFGLPYGNLPVPVKDDYNFMGWNTESDGSGVYVNSESLYAFKNDINLYAIWFKGFPGDVNLDGVVNNSDESLLTTYVSNPSGTSLSIEAKSNADVNLDGVLDNDDIEVLQVYFEGGISGLPYTGEIYTISYNMNGGTGTIASQRKGDDTTITLSSTVPTISNGLVFKGWATSSDATSATYQPGGTYNSNASVTLYAVWKEPAINPIASYCCGTSSRCSGEYDLKYIVTSSSGSSCTVHNDGNNNWRVKFLKSGTLTVATDTAIDVFLVGGGGSGGSGNTGYGGAGGGGGYTKTEKNISIIANNQYKIIIGAGGVGNNEAIGTNGGRTSAFNIYANGGEGAAGNVGGAGGSGGGGATSTNWSNGAAGGSNGSDGEWGDRDAGGQGQGGTTREFGESGATLYGGGGGAGMWGSNLVEGLTRYGGAGGAGGGGDGGLASKGDDGEANTGGGGGGSLGVENYYFSGGSGGSGIVVIRNKR